MRLALAPLIGAAILVGAVGAVGGSWAFRQANARPENLHDVVHKRFDLSAEEHRRLDAAEARYSQRRAEIEARIRAANLELAGAIKSDPQMSPTVVATSGKVEAAAAELQRVTLEHIFEMRAALEPEHRTAYDQVLVSALSRDGSER